jgi:IMP dehydrogenase
MLPLIKEGLTFDDVLLVPRHSKVKSRSDIKLNVNLSGFRFNTPIIPANMKSVSGEAMLHTMQARGGMGLLHRFMPFGEQLTIMSQPNVLFGHVGVSLGVNEIDLIHLEQFYKIGVRIFCIDVAHGDSDACIEMTKAVAAKTGTLVISGNVATGDGASRLWAAGADVVKVGVGPGSLCTTRIETGNGVPQLTALMEIAAVRDHMNYKGRKFIIADGGIKNAGDCVKALCFSDMVMVGNLLAGTDETPGDFIKLTGANYKRYDGSSTHKTNRVEGVTALVPSKGPVEHILTKLEEGIQSGCSYQGASNLAELKLYVHMIRITNAGLQESHPHDVAVIK